jgi:hypothetical protein
MFHVYVEVVKEPTWTRYFWRWQRPVYEEPCEWSQEIRVLFRKVRSPVKGSQYWNDLTRLKIWKIHSRVSMKYKLVEEKKQGD